MAGVRVSVAGRACPTPNERYTAEYADDLESRTSARKGISRSAPVASAFHRFGSERAVRSPIRTTCAARQHRRCDPANPCTISMRNGRPIRGPDLEDSEQSARPAQARRTSTVRPEGSGNSAGPKHRAVVLRTLRTNGGQGAPRVSSDTKGRTVGRSRRVGILISHCRVREPTEPSTPAGFHLCPSSVA